MSVYADTAKGFDAGQKAESRPEFITDEHLEYLDELRESGATNMFGARPYIEREFPELTSGQSSTILSYWMKTFGKDNR